MNASVEGLDEFKADMRQAIADLPKDFKNAKLEGSKILLAEVVEAWPKESGQMAGTFKPFANKNTAGVRSNHPGAAALEFAKTYLRKSRSSGRPPVRVTMHKGTPARYAYPALDRVADRIVQVAHDALQRAFTAKGWFSED